MSEIDTTPVQCPNKCIPVEPRQFRWHEDAVEDIGTRNYCRKCGAELEPTDSRSIIIS